jgi:hypothetical protein
MRDEGHTVGAAAFDNDGNLLGRAWKDDGAGAKIFRRHAVIDHGDGLALPEISVTDDGPDFGGEFWFQTVHWTIPVDDIGK